MNYQKPVEFGGEKFTIVCDTMKELIHATKHFEEMRWKSSGPHVENARWRIRVNDNDNQTYYEVWATVDGKFAKLSISQYKEPENGIEFFIAGHSRWEHYDHEEKQTYVFEARRENGKIIESVWVPATRKKGKWEYLADGWWNGEEEEERPLRRKKKRPGSGSTSKPRRRKRRPR